MEFLLPLFFVFLIGACIGSFLNVVALRALTKESIVLPASKCPKCQTPIKWYDNIPIFSYFFTFKGKCRSCKEPVSIQYPIVETITAITFLAVYIAFGLSIKSLLLLILACTAIVIIITDIKKEYVFEVHAWILIAVSFITSFYLNNDYVKPAIGLILGFMLMELIAKGSYFLVRKESSGDEKSEEIDTCDDIDDENFDINKYVTNKKRAFGEGDTYLASAVGALLGWKYLFLALFVSIIIQAMFILPKFIKKLYENGHIRLIFSILSFIAIAVLYWICSNITELNFYITFAVVVLLCFFAIDSINRLKQTTDNTGFTAIPFGPALLISAFLILFWGKNIAGFLFKHIFI